MIRWRQYLLMWAWCMLAAPAWGQLYSNTNYGANIGIVTAIGNRYQRIGLTLQGYYYHDFAQVNAEIRAYHNFKSPGPRRRYNELVVSTGIVAGYGAKQTIRDTFLSTTSNQTGYVNSVGYAYNLYFNRIGTTQQTGIIAFRFNKVSILSENDLFARVTLDRFRTGALLVQYEHDNRYQFAINCTMWTGQMGRKVTGDPDFPYGCYMDTTGGVYTRYSSGLLSAQFKMPLNSSQDIQANMGIDAEQVRNYVQNLLTHDMVLLPKKWRSTKNCHIPMLDTAGNQYLYKPGQKIRPVKPYWNIFTSAATFY